MTKKTSNTMKAVEMNRKPTAEQLAAERTRALRQKLMAIAEAVYIQLAGNPAYADKKPAVLRDRAVALAEDWLAEIYGLRKKDDASAE